MIDGMPKRVDFLVIRESFLIEILYCLRLVLLSYHEFNVTDLDNGEPSKEYYPSNNADQAVMYA